MWQLWSLKYNDLPQLWRLKAEQFDRVLKFKVGCYFATVMKSDWDTSDHVWIFSAIVSTLICVRTSDDYINMDLYACLGPFRLHQHWSVICSISGDYINTDQVYEDIQDKNNLKKHMQDMLEDYNSMAGIIHMDLVLFRDAIEHSE